MKNITYRKLNPEDAEAFKALRIEAVIDSPASFHPDPDELLQTSISDFRTQIRPSDFQAVYGAFGNGELVGTAGLIRDAMKKMWHRANVWGVYTKASYRGRGIARELLQTLLDDIRTSGHVSTLYLSVNSRNNGAKTLYKSIGFETYGLQRRSMLVDGEFVDEELMDLHIQKTLQVGPNAAGQQAGWSSTRPEGGVRFTYGEFT